MSVNGQELTISWEKDFSLIRFIWPLLPTDNSFENSINLFIYVQLILVKLILRTSSVNSFTFTVNLCHIIDRKSQPLATWTIIYT